MKIKFDTAASLFASASLGFVVAIPFFSNLGFNKGFEDGVKKGIAQSVQQGRQSYVPGNSGRVIAPSVSLAESRMVEVVKADSASYYGNNATITTVVEIDDYFNYGFRGAQSSHYSFQVNGASNYLHAYGVRSRFKDLFDYIVENDGKALVKVTITTSPQHEDNGIWSLVGWEKV